MNTRQGFVLKAQKLAEQLVAVSDMTDDSIKLDFKTLEIELNQLVKQWQNAGQVDRGVYQEINHQFNLILQPVKSAIKAFHQENRTAKQALISRAEKLLNDEDVFSAVKEVKALQTQWRNIGYAGQKIENKLWQSFRKINDDIFAKREQQSVLEKSLSTAKVAELEAALKTLEENFSQATQLNDLQQYAQALQTLHQEVVQQKPKMPALEKQIIAKDKTVANKIVDCKTAIEKQQWNYLFATLEQATTTQQDFTEQIDYQQLSVYWQKKLKELTNKTRHVNREEATLELEILSGLPSPSDLQQRRMAVQVKLMQVQMSSGVSIDLPAKFSQWLMLGQFTQQDVDLLARIKPVFQ